MFSSVGMFFAIKLKNHEGTITVALENRTSRVPSIACLIGGVSALALSTGLMSCGRRAIASVWPAGCSSPCLIWILFASYPNLYVLAADGTGF